MRNKIPSPRMQNVLARIGTAFKLMGYGHALAVPLGSIIIRAIATAIRLLNWSFLYTMLLLITNCYYFRAHLNEPYQVN